jgi:hypothetical protein
MRMIFVLLLVCPAIAAAGDTRSVFTRGTGGLTSCGQFIAVTEGYKLNTYTKLQQNGMTLVSENKAMFEYVQGVLTGINAARDDKHQIQNDNEAIDLWLRNWCNKNPTKSLFVAILTFASETPGTPLK